jgi:hypothetical protein
VSKGIKYGREIVAAVSEPLDGQLLAGQVASTGINQWARFATDETPIEGVVVKALAANTGTVYVTGPGGVAAGFPLAAGESVSMAIDDLAKVYLFFAALGDGAAYLAIGQA